MRAPITINAGNDDFPKYGDATLRHAGGMAQLQQEYANRLFAGAAETEAKRQQQERAYEVENQMLDKKLANATKIAGMRDSNGTASTLRPTPGEIINSSTYQIRLAMYGEDYVRNNYETLLGGKDGTKLLYRFKGTTPPNADNPVNNSVPPAANRGAVAPPPAIPSTPQPPAPPAVPGPTSGAPSPSAGNELVIGGRKYQATPDGLREIK